MEENFYYPMSIGANSLIAPHLKPFGLQKESSHFFDISSAFEKSLVDIGVKTFVPDMSVDTNDDSKAAFSPILSGFFTVE